MSSADLGFFANELKSELPYKKSNLADLVSFEGGRRAGRLLLCFFTYADFHLLVYLN
jgi:hypothetical protein